MTLSSRLPPAGVATTRGGRVVGCGPAARVGCIGVTAAAAGVRVRVDRTGAIGPTRGDDIGAVDVEPLKDITAVRRVVFVMKNGRVYKNTARGAPK